MAMAIPFIVGANLAIDMSIGALTLYVWQRVNRVKADTYGAATASGEFQCCLASRAWTCTCWHQLGVIPDVVL